MEQYYYDSSSDDEDIPSNDPGQQPQFNYERLAVQKRIQVLSKTFEIAFANSLSTINKPASKQAAANSTRS